MLADGRIMSAFASLGVIKQLGFGTERRTTFSAARLEGQDRPILGIIQRLRVHELAARSGTHFTARF